MGLGINYLPTPLLTILHIIHLIQYDFYYFKSDGLIDSDCVVYIKWVARVIQETRFFTRAYLPNWYFVRLTILCQDNFHQVAAPVAEGSPLANKWKYFTHTSDKASLQTFFNKSFNEIKTDQLYSYRTFINKTFNKIKNSRTKNIKKKTIYFDCG